MSSKYPPEWLLPVLIIATVAWLLYANWQAKSLPGFGEDILAIVAYAATVMLIVGLIIWIAGLL